MQFQFRIDDANVVTIQLQLQKAGDDSPLAGPEVIAAAIADAKLSNVTQDQLFDLAGQILDYFSTSVASQKPSNSDWFENEWMPNI